MKRAFRQYIGNYLLDSGAITLDDLDRALANQLAWAAQRRPLKIGAVLLEMKLITREQLERALARQAQDAEDA